MLCAAVAALVVSVLPGCGGGGKPEEATTTAAAPATVAFTPATQAAKRACASQSPAAVLRTSLPAARRRAAGPARKFLKALAHPPRSLVRSPGYSATAARVYAMSLPQSDRSAGYAGCLSELSRKESHR